MLRLLERDKCWPYLHAAVCEKCSAGLAIEYPDFVRLWGWGLLWGNIGSVRGVECRVCMPREGLMAMVGVWGRVWFMCRGIVSGVKRVWGGTGHVHVPENRESGTKPQAPR